MFRLPPTSTLFPCTTLFRSLLRARRARAAAVDPVQVEPQRLDHVGRDLADDEVDEVPALDGERGVHVDLQALHGGGQDRVGRRVGCALRSEERRVGKEGRYRWSPYH